MWGGGGGCGEEALVGGRVGRGIRQCWPGVPIGGVTRAPCM